MENNLENSGDKILKSVKHFIEQYTPEYFQELAVKSYNFDREYPENFSNWYKHIEDFGYFRHAEIINNQIFSFDEYNLFRDDNKRVESIGKIKDVIKPTIDLMKPAKDYNIKNGCFSNKFNFENCMVTIDNIAEKLWNLNYDSQVYDTGGVTELVVREMIPYDMCNTPTIYNGMPLREELRVFYNMDTEEIEYMEDYWNYDYCIDNIYNVTDKIIFNWFHNESGNRKTIHKEKLEELKQLVKDNIHTLKFDDGLRGVWSIDFMCVDDIKEYQGLWLIDMARGFRSAYWNIDKLKLETKIKY